VNRVTRREFVKLGLPAVACVSAVASAKVGSLTAQDVVDRIKRAAGVDWNAATVDTFKAGAPSTVVTGVVTTSLATMDVLRRAVKAGANMVISSGPTFYSRADSPTPPTDRSGAAPASSDPVFAAKHAFLEANRLVVWRFSDHWRMRTPDPFAQGLTDALDWAAYRSIDDPRRVTVPATTLDALATDVKTKLDARGGLRVVGNPQTRIRQVGLLPGSTPIRAALTLLPNVDAIVAGEVREWESVEYARDTVTAGFDKGLILIGRTLADDTGMKVCARWLETIVPEVPCRWIPAGDPYWRPAP
jgi:putative NIF3 family GTP cyclohydrolase 1 type 2